MTAPTPNVAELLAIYWHIKTHPEEWNQLAYGWKGDCGTAYCFAGHAAVRTGAVLQWDNLSKGDFATYATLDGEKIPIWRLARKALGLTGNQSNLLFYEYNSLNSLRRVITEICGVDPESDEARATAGVSA